MKILLIAALTAVAAGCASNPHAPPSGYTFKNFGQGPNFRWTTPSGRVLFHWETMSGANCDKIAIETDIYLEKSNTHGYKLSCTSEPIPKGYIWKMVVTEGPIEADAYFPSFAECENIQKAYEKPQPGNNVWVRVKCFNSTTTTSQSQN